MSAKGFYNGFSPADRDGTLAIVRAAVADGRVPSPAQCSVCGERPTKPLGWHSEDYRTPLAARPICGRCHYAVHIRFRRPDYWQAYIAALAPGSWFHRLSVDPAALERPFDETYPHGL